jgi:peptidoglycan glycosyltransferase
MNRIAKRSVAILILVAILVGGLGMFIGKYLANGSDWVMHEGSPHIYSGENLGTGMVVDREGLLLLDLKDNRTYSVSKELRMSTMHWLGDRYGYVSAPALATYAKEMAGYNSLTGLYSYSGAGQAKLTLSAYLQMAALKAMGDYKGTLAIYNYKTGEILCAVTTPTYDPDNMPDIQNDTTGSFDGVYMNRFIQSVYIPGSIFKIVTTAAALEELSDIREMTYTCTGIHPYGNDSVTCEYAHGTLDFDSALAQSCNCAFAQIVDRLGSERLKEYVDKYQITQPVRFDGLTTAAGNFQAAGSRVEAAWSGIGQYTDQINPCRFLTFMGAIANGGAAVEPHLVKEVTCDGKLTYQASPVVGDAILPAEIAQELQTMMRNNVLEKYGPENFPAGMTVCGKSGTGQVGGNKKSNAMFCGFVTDEEYPLAFIAAVEDAGYGRFVCVPILSEVLAACKEMMDA